MDEEPRPAPVPFDPADYIGRTITEDEKINLLRSKFQCCSDFQYPKTGKRRFVPSWTDTRPWLRYSVKKNAAFCLCLCYGTDVHVPGTTAESPFVSTGFRNWQKALGKDGKLDQHQGSEFHRLAEEKVTRILQTFEKPDAWVDAQLKKQLADQRVRTKLGLLSIIDIVISLGLRGIPLRGHNWDKVEKEEDGNFTFFLKWKSNYDANLHERHLTNASKNSKYTSPQIQNEIISLCDAWTRKSIILSIPEYWSVMADETQDCSTTEQVSISVRYVDVNYEICEDFLGFIKVKKMDAQTIAKELLETLEKWGLDMASLVGQGYDGASVMSSSKNGVQAMVAAKYPNALYVHCRSHALNLAIAGGCKGAKQVQNVFDNVGKLTWFLGGSAKRKEIFLEEDKSKARELNEFLMECSKDSDEFTQSIQALKEGSQKVTVPKFCPTRWSARLLTLSSVLAKYPTVLDALDTISDSSTGDAKSEAESYIRLMESSAFIVAVSVAQFVLSYLALVTKTLQAKQCDLVQAYKDVELAKECIHDARNEQTWATLWDRIQHVGQAAGIEITKPRTTTSQRHRENAGQPDQTASDYYRVNVFYPFIDHVLQELQNRFNPEVHKGLIAAQYLVPSDLHLLTDTHMKNIVEYYGKFLTRQESYGFEYEVRKWRKLHDKTPAETRPKSPAEALKCSSRQIFPAIHRILIILLTTPVGSVSCERSFSALRRLKLWTRASMDEERLSGLAMLLIHRGQKHIPSPEDIYGAKANWRLHD